MEYKINDTELDASVFISFVNNILIYSFVFSSPSSLKHFFIIFCIISSYCYLKH